MMPREEKKNNVISGLLNKSKQGGGAVQRLLGVMLALVSSTLLKPETSLPFSFQKGKAILKSYFHCCVLISAKRSV